MGRDYLWNGTLQGSENRGSGLLRPCRSTGRLQKEDLLQLRGVPRRRGKETENACLLHKCAGRHQPLKAGSQSTRAPPLVAMGCCMLPSHVSCSGDLFVLGLAIKVQLHSYLSLQRMLQVPCGWVGGHIPHCTSTLLLMPYPLHLLVYTDWTRERQPRQVWPMTCSLYFSSLNSQQLQQTVSSTCTFLPMALCLSPLPRDLFRHEEFGQINR